MEDRIKENLLEFLKRVDLKGYEVEAFNEILHALRGLNNKEENGI